MFILHSQEETRVLFSSLPSGFRSDPVPLAEAASPHLLDDTDIEVKLRL